jgi:hypothetical protein
MLRHMVGIYFDFRLNGERHQFVQTAFVFAVEGRWLLMTAGHCVTDIAKIRAAGGILTACLLIDSLGEGAQHFQPVPINYDDAQPTHIGINESIDYGILVLNVNICRLLAANNIQPFDERAWDAEPAGPQEYFLVGFPAQVNQLQGNRVTFNASMFRLERYAERPDDFPPTDLPLYFYGRAIAHPLDSLCGCSGGPILAFAPPDQEGHSRVHLIAMQVSTLGEHIKGMLMPPLGDLVRDILNGRYGDDGDDGDGDESQ